MEKNNKVIVVLLIVLIIGLIGSNCYMIYDRYLKKEPTTNDNIKENEEVNVPKEEENQENNKSNDNDSNKYDTLDINSSEVVNLVDGINNNYIGMSDYFKKDKFTYNDYTNSDKFYLALIKKLSDKSCYAKSLECSLTKEEFENNLYILFNNKNYNDINTNLRAHNYIVVKENNRYYTWLYGGGSSPYKFIQKIVDAKKYSDKIEIYEQNFIADMEDHYGTDSEDKQYYYKIYKSQENLESGEINGKDLVATEYYTGWIDNLDEYNKAIFEKYKDQLYTYKYTFNLNKETNTYYFVSVEKVK